MQNLNFSRRLIFQPLLTWEAETSVIGICLKVGFTFSASHQLPDGAGVALGIFTHLLFTDEIQSNIWGAKYLAWGRPLGFTGREVLWYTSGWKDSLFSSFTWGCMFLAGRSRARATGEPLMYPLMAHMVHCAALRGGSFSAESVFSLLPRFQFCSYRLVHPCKENNT